MPPAPRSASPSPTACPTSSSPPMPAARRSPSASCSRPAPDFWNIGAALTAPIFDGGTLLHQERAARAAYDAGGRAISQHRADRLPECRRHADGAGAGRRRPESRGRCRRRRQDDARPHPAPIAGRLRRHSGTSERRAGLSAGATSRSCRRRPTAMPTPPRCFRRWAAAGGIAPIWTRTKNDNKRFESPARAGRVAAASIAGCSPKIRRRPAAAATPATSR